MSCTVQGMTPRKLHAQSIYLDPDKAKLLDELATGSRIAKAVLLREAVDDLLVKYKLLQSPRRRPRRAK